MSDKFFFKGRQTPKPAYGESGYNTKRQSKLGSKAQPLQLIVASEARQAELESVINEQKLFAQFTIDTNQAENITALEFILNKPTTVTAQTKINRNDPCTCGSGKKFKKCCG